MAVYPFEEDRYIDRQAFAVLSKYFDVRDSIDPDGYGTNLFEWGNGWDVLEGLPNDELSVLSAFLFPLGRDAFVITKENLRSPNNFSYDRLFELMTKRGITQDSFLDAIGDLEYVVLGGESTQIIGGIANALQTNQKVELSMAATNFGNSRENYVANKEKLDVLNAGREQPFDLDHVLKLDATPVCLRYSQDGLLYVLDDGLGLHEFDHGEKTNEWKLLRRSNLPSVTESMIGTPSVFANIAVENGHVFLATGSSELVHYDLVEGRKHDGMILPNRTIGRFRSRYRVHDVVIKDGAVLMSVTGNYSAEEAYVAPRSIVQVVSDGSETSLQLLYGGRRPEGFSFGILSDHTLRLDIHDGHLYFPRGNGISLYRGIKPDGEKPKEMLEGYARELTEFDSVDPITKFSFGDDFMVAQARLDGFRKPMLCVFRAQYDEKPSEELVGWSQRVAPDRFTLEHAGYVPKMTGQTLWNASLSAHGQNFAMTHTMFNKVFVYRMKK